MFGAVSLIKQSTTQNQTPHKPWEFLQDTAHFFECLRPFESEKEKMKCDFKDQEGDQSI